MTANPLPPAAHLAASLAPETLPAGRGLGLLGFTGGLP